MYFLVRKIKHAIHKFLFLPIIKRTALKKCGKKVYIGENFRVNRKRLSIGDYSSIGSDAFILCTNADVSIGKHVVIANGLTIITGKHRFNIVGRFISDIGEKEKEPTDDQSVIIEEDVWIAAYVTILKGITIGRGSIIGTGSIVTKNVEPYSIVAGVPAKKIAMRFTDDEIREHEQKLNIKHE